MTGPSLSRGPPLSRSDVGAGPCLPITLCHLRARSLPGWTGAQGLPQAASPHVVPTLGLGSWEESCVSSSVSM